MKRTVATDWAYVPDCEFTQRDFKRRLGITERNRVRDVRIRGDSITIEVFRGGELVRYETGQQEFKDMLGITDRRAVLVVYASVWDRKVQISHAGN